MTLKACTLLLLLLAFRASFRGSMNCANTILLTSCFLAVLEAAPTTKKPSNSGGEDDSPILDFLENLDAGELTGIIVGGLIGLIILCAIIEACRQCCQDHECCRERNSRNRVAAEPGVGDSGHSAVDSDVYYIRSRAPVSASGLNQCSTELDMGENGEQGPPPYEYADTRAAVVPFRKYRNIDKGRDVVCALQTRSKHNLHCKE